jgi:probable HAF family extracellular repeat protein
MPFAPHRAPLRKTLPAAACGFALFAAGILTTQANARAAGASFTPIGDLPGGNFSSSAIAVSADGSLVVGASGSASGTQEAFRWTRAGGMVGLGDLPGGEFYSVANSVSADGSVVAGYATVAPGTTVHQAFRWTAAGGMVGLGYLPGGDYSLANEISASGNAVVGFSDTSRGNFEAFRWTEAGGMVSLGMLPGHGGSAALGVSGDGTVVVGTSSVAVGGAHLGFRWTPTGGMTPLAPLAGDAQAQVSRVSTDGLVTVGMSEGTVDRHAVRWIANGIAQPLGLVSGVTTGKAQQAVSVSADGFTIVGIADTGAFVWDPSHGARDLKTVLTRDYGLNLTGWNLTRPWDVSADGGTIVGVGTDPQGRTQGFVAVIPVPEPGAVAAVGGFALLLLRRRRRVRQ